MISFHCYYVLFYFKPIVISLFCFIGLEAHLIWIPAWAHFGHCKGPSPWPGPQFKPRQMPCPTLQHRSPKPSRSGLAVTNSPRPFGSCMAQPGLHLASLHTAESLFLAPSRQRQTRPSHPNWLAMISNLANIDQALSPMWLGHVTAA